MSDPCFGLCPVCHETDGFLNIGRDHWFCCHAHRTRWHAGSNLFSGWKDETEETWRVNAERIGDYADVEPWMGNLVTEG